MTSEELREYNKKCDRITLSVVKRMCEIRRPLDYCPKVSWHKWVYGGHRKG